MPEYDAFGREIGEDTLSGLGGDPSAPSQPVVSPVPSDGYTDTASAGSATEVPIAPPPGAQPSTFTIPGQVPTGTPPKVRRRRARGLGCLFSLVFLALLVAGPVIVLVSLIDDAENTFDSITGVIESTSPEAADPGPPPEPEAPAPPPAGIGGRSMIAEQNLKRGIATLRKQARGALGRVVVRPTNLNGWLITRRDNRRDVDINYDGSVRKADPVDVGIAQETIPWDELDPAAPARLVRASAKRFKGARPERIDYLIASPNAPFDDGHRWVAYFKTGVYVEGDGRGRVVRRIG